MSALMGDVDLTTTDDHDVRASAASVTVQQRSSTNSRLKLGLLISDLYGRFPGLYNPDLIDGQKLSLAVFASFALWFSLRSLCLAIRFSTSVTFADQWEFVLDLMQYEAGTYKFSDLFNHHNEHIILTGRVSMFIDFFLFHLCNISVVITQYLVLAILAGVLAKLGAKGRPVSVQLSAFLCSLATLWSTAGWINLGLAFQIVWAYLHLFSALTMVCFAAAALRTGSASCAFLATACFCDGLASFSLASGLCTIFPVLILSAWLHARGRLLTVYCVWHVVVLTIFFWRYVSPPQDLVFNPMLVLHYLAPYLGTVLPDTTRGAVLLGNVGLIVIFIATSCTTWASLARRKSLDPSLLVLLAIAIFIVIEGCANAFGRASLPESTILALRYGTPSEVFWISLSLAALRAAWLWGASRTSFCLAVTALVGMSASNTAGESVTKWAELSTRIENIGFNLINGVWTGESALSFYPRPSLIQDRIAFLRDHQLGPFAEQEARFRAPLNGLAGMRPADLPACVGETDPWSLDPEGQLHIRGWAMTPGLNRSPAWLAAYGPQGRLIGYAATWRRRIVPREKAGRSVVFGYDTWLHPGTDEDPRSLALVMIFPGGTAPPCLAPPLNEREAGTSPDHSASR